MQKSDSLKIPSLKTDSSLAYSVMLRQGDSIYYELQCPQAAAWLTWPKPTPYVRLPEAALSRRPYSTKRSVVPRPRWEFAWRASNTARRCLVGMQVRGSHTHIHPPGRWSLFSQLDDHDPCSWLKWSWAQIHSSITCLFNSHVWKLLTNKADSIISRLDSNKNFNTNTL
jgi:hypothetical protein